VTWRSNPQEEIVHIIKSKYGLLIAAIIVAILIILLYLFRPLSINVIENDSHFNGYIVKDGFVYMYCTVAIVNNSSENTEFYLVGDFTDDNTRGLVKEKYIKGKEYKITYAMYDELSGETTSESELISSNNYLKLNANSKRIFNVVFIGEFNGNDTKANRDLPNLSIELMLSSNNKIDIPEDFSVDDYYYYIENFPSDKIVGKIENIQQAQEQAENVWFEIYGSSINKLNKPYIVSYDSLSDAWLISGNLPKNYVGGVPHIIIQKADGKVLAVWHDK
jgi:hypothetical protein